MRLLRVGIIFVLVVGVLGVLDAQQGAPHRKRVLAIGAVQGYQQDSVWDGLAMIYNLGKETGLWDTFSKTETQSITTKKLESNAKNPDYCDALNCFTTGEL